MTRVTVKLKVGETIVEKAITDHDRYAEFLLDLPAGNTQVQAWLLDQDQNTHGACYVHVQSL